MKKVRAPENYTLTFRNPPDCIVSECEIFAGVDINDGNPSYLDIYLEGQAQSWVAIGFTDTPNMVSTDNLYYQTIKLGLQFSADVLGCNLMESNGMNSIVEVLDTWNLDEGRGNVVDDIQDVYLFSGNFIDGRITCS